MDEEVFNFCHQSLSFLSKGHELLLVLLISLVIYTGCPAEKYIQLKMYTFGKV